jgi:uridine phosphorylase
MLDNPDKVYHRASTRGFLYYTGHKNGVPISIVATGMGFPMMDFAVRELRAVVDGPLVIVRLGSCGSPSPQCPVGTTVAASRAVRVDQIPDALWEEDTSPQHDALKYYRISPEVKPDAQLHSILVKHLHAAGTGLPVLEGITAAGDSYYSSQVHIRRKTKTFPPLFSCLPLWASFRDVLILILMIETSIWWTRSWRSTT